MFLLSPRFFALPLIAVTVILSLPRGDQQPGQEKIIVRAPAVERVVGCAPVAGASNCAVSVAVNAAAVLR